jgi:hypothetical protein
MSYQEKQARFNLAVLALTLSTFLVLLPFLGVQRSMAAFAWLGLLGFSPILYVMQKRNSQVVSDERDLMIQSRTWVIAYSVFWLVFVGGSMTLWAIYRNQGYISVNILPMFPLVGWIVLTFVQSVATLSQYGQGK